MTVESPEQAVELLDRAEEFLRYGRDNEAYELLESVEQSAQVPDTQRPRLLWLLGEACYRGQSYDAAVYYFDQCASAGDSTLAAQAQERIAELRRTDQAFDTGAGGVDTVAEVDQLVQAADEAFSRGDLSTAYDLYAQAYRYPGVEDARLVRAAVGLGRTLFYQQQYDQAREYLEYANANPGEHGEEIRRLLAEIDQYEQASRSVDDGMQGREAREVWDAAVAAGERRDYETAIRLFEQFQASPVLSGRAQIRVSYNLGFCHLNLGNYSRALEYLEAPARAGHEDAQRLIDRINRGDQAMESIGLDLTTE